MAVAALVASSAVLAAVPASKSTTAEVKPVWAGISVRDAEASAKWYQHNLHFEITKKMDLPEHKLGIVFMRLNGFTLELIEFRDSVSFEEAKKRVPELADRDKLQGFVKLDFQVKDVDALAGELEGHSIKLRMKPTDDPPFGQRFFLVEDNDGNTLQFFQPLK